MTKDSVKSKAKKIKKTKKIKKKTSSSIAKAESSRKMNSSKIRAPVSKRPPSSEERSQESTPKKKREGFTAYQKMNLKANKLLQATRAMYGLPMT
jgi:hypothetical protein